MFLKAFLDRLLRSRVRPLADARPPAAAAIEALRAAAPAPAAAMPTRFSASTRADTYSLGPDTGRAESMRRPTHDDDFVLSDAAANWVLDLPAALQPEWTVLLFPRIVNRLARCWRDAELLDALFDDLLHDRRGNRAGLPPHVHDEIVRLEKHRGREAAQRGAAPAAPSSPMPANRAVPAEAIDILL